MTVAMKDEADDWQNCTRNAASAYTSNSAYVKSLDLDGSMRAVDASGVGKYRRILGLQAIYDLGSRLRGNPVTPVLA